MRENLFDVLMYLFENYAHEKAWLQNHSQQTILAEMIDIGFDRQKVHEAFEWFDHLEKSFSQSKQSPIGAIRIYTPEETFKTSCKARGYLLQLEQTGIIDATVRELIIDRAMALQEHRIGIFEIKWVTLMVLCNHPELKNQFNLEELVLDGVEYLLN